MGEVITLPARLENGAMAPARIGWDAEQVELLRQTVCQGASDAELAFFGQVCQRTGLDPFARQIYLIKRQGKMMIQTGIDGFRLVAHRTGLYAGNEEIVFTGTIQDGKNEYPEKATATAYKMVAGQRCRFTATARWREYYPGEQQGHMWRKMPFTMLGKCAEALVLRMAFQELSGVYSGDEMAQAEPVRVDASTGEVLDAAVVDVSSRVTGASEREHSYSGAAGARNSGGSAEQRKFFTTLTGHCGKLSDEVRRAVASILTGKQIETFADFGPEHYYGLQRRLDKHAETCGGIHSEDGCDLRQRAEMAVRCQEPAETAESEAPAGFEPHEAPADALLDVAPVPADVPASGFGRD